MKTYHILSFALLAAAVCGGGCASRPENIPPAYASEMTYRGWTEEQMRAEQERLKAALSSAAAQQHKTRANDTAGVWLLGVPISSMTGRGVESEIARLKGELEALQKAATAAGFSIPAVDLEELTRRKS